MLNLELSRSFRVKYNTYNHPWDLAWDLKLSAIICGFRWSKCIPIRIVGFFAVIVPILISLLCWSFLSPLGDALAILTGWVAHTMLFTTFLRYQRHLSQFWQKAWNSLLLCRSSFFGKRKHCPVFFRRWRRIQLAQQRRVSYNTPPRQHCISSITSSILPFCHMRRLFYCMSVSKISPGLETVSFSAVLEVFPHLR